MWVSHTLDTFLFVVLIPLTRRHRPCGHTLLYLEVFRDLSQMPRYTIYVLLRTPSLVVGVTSVRTVANIKYIDTCER